MSQDYDAYTIACRQFRDAARTRMDAPAAFNVIVSYEPEDAETLQPKFDVLTALWCQGAAGSVRPQMLTAAMIETLCASLGADLERLEIDEDDLPGCCWYDREPHPVWVEDFPTVAQVTVSGAVRVLNQTEWTPGCELNG